MSSTEVIAAIPEAPKPSQEVTIGPYSDERAAADDIHALLKEAGIDLADCVFSGHANTDFAEKEKIDFEEEYDALMPDEAPDDALLIWFSSELTDEQDTGSPLWYAYEAGDDLMTDPIVDVLNIKVLEQIVPKSLLAHDSQGGSWITPEQYKVAKICRFVIKR